MLEELTKRIEDIEKRIEFDPNNENNYRNLIYSYPILNYVDERKLFEFYRTTYNKEIRDIIFKCHLRDVYDSCTDISGYKLDLVSEGNILMLELIDTFDYKMPYITFTQFLKTRLTVLYKKMTDDNNASLDTKMSTYELACLEEKGKNLTNYRINEESNIFKELSHYAHNNNHIKNKYDTIDNSILMTRKLVNRKDEILKKKRDAILILKKLFNKERN